MEVRIILVGVGGGVKEDKVRGTLAFKKSYIYLKVIFSAIVNQTGGPLYRKLLCFARNQSGYGNFQKSAKCIDLLLHNVK